MIILVQDLRSLDLSEMLQLMEELNEPAFRAKQLFAWVHNKEISSLDEASNLGKGLLEKIKPKSFDFIFEYSKETSVSGWYY